MSSKAYALNTSSAVGHTPYSRGLIAFDLDGTVWPDRVENKMAPRVEVAFQAAKSRRYTITVSTGRPLVELPLDFLRLPWLDWAIYSSGAAVYDLGLHVEECGSAVGENADVAWRPKPCMAATLKYEQIGTIFRLTDGYKASHWIDTPEGYYVEANGLSPSIRKFFDSRGRVIESARNIPALRRDAYKVSVHFSDANDREHVQSTLEKTAEWPFDFANEGELSLEFSPKGTNKGAAAMSICRFAGIQPESSVAFGDSGNDLSFADTPIRFIAMGNAEPKVRAAADGVCPDVFSDGVAVWLEEHVLDCAN